MNKKGNVGEGIFFLVAIVAIGLVFIISNLLLTEINAQFQDTDQISALGKSLIQENTTKFPIIFDNMMLFLFIGLTIAIIAVAWFNRTHPLVFFISIPLLAFVIFLSAIYANAYDIIIQDVNIAASAAQFSTLNFILGNYVYFITGVVILVSIMTFAKNRRADL